MPHWSQRRLAKVESMETLQSGMMYLINPAVNKKYGTLREMPDMSIIKLTADNVRQCIVSPSDELLRFIDEGCAVSVINGHIPHIEILT